jgi:hypothetical protein
MLPRRNGGCAIATAFRPRNSVLDEVLLIAIVYGLGILIVLRQYFALDAATWYATPSAGGAKLSLAARANGYEVVHTMRLAPITQEAILRPAGATPPADRASAPTYTSPPSRMPNRPHSRLAVH